MNVLVTGAGGFIGSHLTEALINNGSTVRALVHYNSKGSFGNLESFASQYPNQLEVRLGDITDTHYVNRLVEGCEIVYHLAALIGIPYSYHAPASYVSTNVNGSLNILEACRTSKVRRVIITSTSEVYGTAIYTPIDEAHPLQAQSPYSATKIAADKLGEAFFRSFDLPVVILRPFNTYGPRQSARAVIPTILTQILSGSKEINLGNLNPRRDLTYVEDTVKAFLLAGKAQGIEGEVIHFGNGKAYSVREIAEHCLEITGCQSQIVATKDRERPEKSEVGLLLCNAEKAGRLLGWTPSVSLEQGLRNVYKYLKENLGQYRPGDYVV